METKVQLESVESLLQGAFYEVPRFQRPYEWDGENLQQFWADTVEDNPVGYFVGPMVAYQASKQLQLKALVDGQQRMTTIMVALCVVRDHFRELGESDLEQATDRYIQRRDRDNKLRLILDAPDGGEVLARILTNERFTTSLRPGSEGQVAVDRAYRQFKALLASRVKQEGDDHGVAPTEVVRDVRDKLLGLQVIWVERGDEDSAYVFFETLNSRGKDLEPVDLLKNLLFSRTKASNANLDDMRNRWNDMRARLHERRANVSNFLHHWWLAERSFTSEKKLFREMKAHYQKALNPEAAKDVVESLDAAAAQYVKISSPSLGDWTQETREVGRSLIALQDFKVRQPRPLLLAVLTAYAQGRMNLKQVKAMVRMVEAFHFASTAVVGVSSTGGVSQMYAKLARQVSAAKDAQAQSASVEALKRALGRSNRMPAKESFVAEFVKLDFETSKPVVRYVLKRWHELGGLAPLADDVGSLEHFESQRTEAPWCQGIGNLFWISKELNVLLDSRSTQDKAEVLRKHPHMAASFRISEPLDGPVWGEAECNARAGAIAAELYQWVSDQLSLPAKE